MITDFLRDFVLGSLYQYTSDVEKITGKFNSAGDPPAQISVGYIIETRAVVTHVWPPLAPIMIRKYSSDCQMGFKLLI
jgi:hypothetical protein